MKHLMIYLHRWYALYLRTSMALAKWNLFWNINSGSTLQWTFVGLSTLSYLSQTIHPRIFIIILTRIWKWGDLIWWLWFILIILLSGREIIFGSRQNNKLLADDLFATRLCTHDISYLIPARTWQDVSILHSSNK